MPQPDRRARGAHDFGGYGGGLEPLCLALLFRLSTRFSNLRIKGPLLRSRKLPSIAALNVMRSEPRIAPITDYGNLLIGRQIAPARAVSSTPVTVIEAPPRRPRGSIRSDQRS